MLTPTSPANACVSTHDWRGQLRCACVCSCVGHTREHARALALLVILNPQMGNLLLTPQVAQGVLELGELNEEVVLGVEEGSAHRAFEVEGQPLLNTAEAAALCQIKKEYQVED